MKVLSIRQPWAWLIMTGLKDIENRTWNTDFRGRFAIHASKKFDWDALIVLNNDKKREKKNQESTYLFDIN